MFSIGDIHEYESCLDLLILNCKYFWLPETRVFYRPGLYFSILWKYFESFCHLVITFLVCFSFIQTFPNNPYNLLRITFLLWSLFFIFFGIWIIGEIINLIVLAAIIITEKIDNYRYNNFLVEEENIFTTIIINSVEKILIEIWHQRYHWWWHHMITELTYVNIIFHILIYYR